MATRATALVFATVDYSNPPVVLRWATWRAKAGNAVPGEHRRFAIILMLRVRPSSARTLSFKALVMHGVAYSIGFR